MVESEGLERDEALVVVHRQRRVEARIELRTEEAVGGEGALHPKAFLPGRFQGGGNDLIFLVAERAALSGAIVDAAVAGGHPLTEAITTELTDVATDRRASRRQAWAQSKHTAVDFGTMEDET